MAEDIQKRNARQYNWQKENKERINILFDKGTKDRIKLAADKHCQTSSEYIREAIEKSLYSDGIIKEVVKLADQEGQEPKN